jgi:hypothetical protein
MPVFDTEGMRPVVGSDFCGFRHFPDDVQGQFVYACVINMNGIPRWTFSDDGGGYKGVRERRDPNDPATAFDLLKSTDKHFRPVDPQIGPDGALWFGDWANPLIGHMQYSQRDPNRDKKHGRIYRIVYTKSRCSNLRRNSMANRSPNCSTNSRVRVANPFSGLVARSKAAPRPRCLRRLRQWVSRARPGDARLRPTPLRSTLDPAKFPCR